MTKEQTRGGARDESSFLDLHRSFRGVNTQDLASGLQYLVEQQARVNINRPDVGTGSPESMRTYTLAMIVELSEMLQELNWKPWKGEKSLDSDRVADEFADTLAFYGIIITDIIHQAGLTTDDLARAYDRKTQINIERARGEVEGYHDERARQR